MNSRALAAWIVALSICLAVRMGLGGALGEFLCTVLLVVATSTRFGCSSSCCGRGGVNISEDVASSADAAALDGIGDDSGSSPSGEGGALSLRLMGRGEGGSDGIPDAEASDPPLSNDDVADNDQAEVSPPSRQRIRPQHTLAVPPLVAYLDNTKSFLTALVVTHHVGCAFGGCGPNTWYLIVGLNNDNGPFHKFLEALALLDQCFFMPLFFFVSAYFVPTSYARKGGWNGGFREGRMRRILLPALFTMMVTTPACVAWGQYVAGFDTDKMAYSPHPGVAWFLFWLLLLDWMYITVVAVGGTMPRVGTLETMERSDPPAEQRRTNSLLPGTVTRLLWGVGICGLALLPFLVLTPGSLASMPVAPGSVTCDFFMYFLGIKAREDGWLESGSDGLLLRDRMDVRPAFLLFFVIAEGTGIVLLLPVVETNDLAGFGFVCLAGIFCLDMSLLVLVTFQGYLDMETRLTKFFARAAYGVYLMHPLVVTGATAMYVGICNHLGVTDIDPSAIGSKQHEDAGGGTQGETTDGGHEKHLLIGWILVNLASHLVVWPAAWIMTRLPVLKNIL